MKIKKKYLQFDYLCFWTILFLIALKLMFSYLLVDPGYWLRHLPTNYEKFNILNLPQNISSHLEYATLPLMLSFILVNFAYLNKLKGAIVMSFILIGLNLLTALFNNKSIIDSLYLTLKLISPIYFFVCLILFTKKDKIDLSKLVFKFVNLCIILTLIAIIFFDTSINRKVERWPIYFSNIHTHSYIMVSICVAYSYKFFRAQQNIKLVAFFAISFCFLYVGYNVRTPLLLYLIYMFIILFLLSDVIKYFWMQIVFLLPFALLVVFFTFNSIDVNKYSSGRLDMYKEKLEILDNYNMTEFILGRGYGADLTKTETWWWEEKGSHNDYITYLIENGVIYLFGFVLFVLALLPFFKRVNLIYLFLILGYFISSAISNGLSSRPLASYMFFLVLSVIYIDIEKSRKRESLILNENA